MKLLTCEYKGRTFAAASDGHTVWEAAPDMLTLIARLGGKLPDKSLCSGEGIAIGDVKLLAPIPEPAQDVICLGLNYADHRIEADNWRRKRNEVIKNDAAVYFSKRAWRIIGPGDGIDGHFDIVDSLDYEAELAIVIGKDAYKVSAEDAEDYILGYSVFNDISARNIQAAHKQYYFGKSLDTHTAMGPWIVTRDDIAWEPELDIKCFVNGEKRQDSNTCYEIYKEAYVIAELSAGMTLKAGTIIAMGTPAGVGMGSDPPRYLKSGDVVRCEIDGIGALENRVM